MSVLSETPERATPQRPQPASPSPAEGEIDTQSAEGAAGPAAEEEFRLDLLTVAEWALIGPDGRVSLGNAMTTAVQVPALPGGLPPLYLVACVAAPSTWAGHQAALAVRAVDAEGRPVAADPLVSGTATFPAGPEGTVITPRLQFALQIAALPVQRPGRLRFILSLAGDELGEVALDVRQAPPPTTA